MILIKHETGKKKLKHLFMSGQPGLEIENVIITVKR